VYIYICMSRNNFSYVPPALWMEAWGDMAGWPVSNFSVSNFNLVS
jgi:hypothetical protein